MQDILVYVMDSALPTARAHLHLALMAETPSLQMALSQRSALADILPHSSPRRYMTLTTENPYPYDDRPWELFEYMTPLPSSRKHGDQFMAIKAYQDTASLPVSLFDPLIKRDVPGTDNTYLASERNLGNGMVGEPIGARQAATLLYAGAEEEHHDSILPSVPQRRMSTRIASSSSRQMGTNRDPISIDDGEESSDSDSSEEPAPKRPRTGSKTTARPTTGGKALARKTVGGKHVGGKNIGRKTSGKAVKSTRR